MKKINQFLFVILILFSSSFALAQDAQKIDLSDSNASEFLDADEAFKVSADSIEDSIVNLSFKVAEGHYLYKKRIDVKVLKPFKVLEILFPKPDIKNDPNFGISEIYHNSFVLPIRLNSSYKSQSKVEIEVYYQGCSEKGLCYPPTVKSFLLDVKSSGSVKTKFVEEVTNASGDGDLLLKSGNFWLIVLGFFGFGLLLSLTPCVFPMIPILSGIIVGQSGGGAKGHAFKLSVAYTLGMALSYTLAGILAALTGNMISAALQNPWVLGSFSIVFVVLAMSMFGFYEFQLPSSLGSNLTNYTNRIKGGKFAGVFVMGSLSALIVSPCVAAPLAGALIYISKTHNLILGGSALFSLSMGMGVPLLMVGASAGVLLPKAGIWMDAVKNFFGVTMLVMAVWIVAPVIPHYLTLFLYASIVIISSVYWGAFESIREGVSGWARFRKGLCVLTFILGLILLFASLNGLNFFSEISNAESSVVKEKTGVVFKKVEDVEDLNSELNKSKGSFVMLDFYADWCSACKEYEARTFRDPLVINGLKNIVLLQVDVTENNYKDKELMKKFELFGPPGIIFFDKDGKQISKIAGYQDAEQFNLSLSKAISRN